MAIRILHCKIYISLLFLSVLCILLLVDQTGIMLFGICAVILHELGHLAVMAALRILPQEIVLQPAGILIKRKNEITSYKKELAVAAGGCFVNLLLFAVCALLYRTAANEKLMLFAVSNLSIAVFNLIPLHGLDGYDMINIVLSMKLHKTAADRISGILAMFSLLLLTAAATALFIYSGFNTSLAICVIYLGILTLVNLRY